MPVSVPPPWEVVQEADGPFLIADLLVQAGLAATKSEARRVIAQGGAYVNGERVTDEGRVLSRGDLREDGCAVLRRGKRHAALVAVLEDPAGLAATLADFVLLRVPPDAPGPPAGGM